MLIKRQRSWQIPDRLATPSDTYFSRRTVLKGLGLAGASLMGGPARPTLAGPGQPYPAHRNADYVLDRALTAEADANRFNVFDEFSAEHDQVWRLVEGFVTEPWKIHIGGLVAKPLTLDVADLVGRFGLEERLYRHRCVEAWAMAVPWTGFPLRKLVELAHPTAEARFLRMLSFSRPHEAAGWYASRRVFPYYEGLSIAEATHELAFLATGIYGKPLPGQHGAPLRLVVPWKYGLKSAKSLVAFQFTPHRPATFWNDLRPQYYTFDCNVDPDNFPGPWSQAEETMLGTGEKRKTQLYNGYAEQVTALYPGRHG